MTKVLLDTNSYSLYRLGDKRIKKEIDDAEEVIISPVMLGELYSGFYRGDRQDQNLLDLETFLNDSKVLITQITKLTSKIYGQLLCSLLNNGTPVGVNDVWIASSAIETDSTIITYDKHFLKIPGVKVWKHLVE